MSLAHALLLAELLMKAINTAAPAAPDPHTPAPQTQEPNPMDDQSSPPPADTTMPTDAPPIATAETPTPAAPDAPQEVTPAPESAPESAAASSPASIPSTDPATAAAPPPPSGDAALLRDAQTLIAEITQLVQILDKNPDIFNFLRALMAK